MSNKIEIKYYAKTIYGREVEYCVDSAVQSIITQLTGRRGINGITRELLRDLTGGHISWKKVPPPGYIPDGNPPGSVAPDSPH